MIVGSIYITVSYRVRELWNEKYEPGFVLHEHHERGRMVMRPYWYPRMLCKTLEEAYNVARSLARNEIRQLYPPDIPVHELTPAF